MSRRLFILLFVWTLSAAALCEAQSLARRFVTQTGLGQESSPKKAVITFSRSEDYFGVTPAYRLTIYADGSVAYVGEKNVKVKGAAEGRISQPDLQHLIREIREIKFFSLRDKYGADGGCPRYLYDASSVYIRVELDDQEKAVSHDLGCMEEKGMGVFPAGLYELEESVDATVNSNQWVK